MEHKVEIIDEFRVAPPPGSLPSTLRLPLTFLDIPFLIRSKKFTFKRLFFYEYPHSHHEFAETAIPLLKSSLSLTLQYFYPFVSNLILPLPPQKPYILFTEGGAVSFTVAHCSGEFDHVISNDIKDVKLLRSFALTLPPTRVSSDGTRVDSPLAVQVTLFPNQGICIGIGTDHAVADGRTAVEFMKSWASICRSNGVVEVDKFLMPSFNRDEIEDPYELESRWLRKWQDLESEDGGNDKLCCLSIAGDLRNRIAGITTTYFGNCVARFSADVKRSELISDNGLIVAARAIGKCIKDLERDGAMRTMEKWATADDKQVFGSAIVLAVASSPKFNVYKTDFGWGFPKKVEMPHLESVLNAVSFAECRDEGGGIEFALELKKAEMDSFTKHFNQGLKLF
ncbi:coumaroyl-CoA:anthocyanidin 3-O-glucoside-6''-O-coumaroyltransferase 1-like [Rutidosis leptorrhynchoides]|uniref:coumaroyl-CoA:anthocyanidin 3-O-glucoside-6''-O-coumaroyltransferase 1-like n=1 Tax=Rutidosis leptorrhynchoides TaxID=125765 RepID=UPI003A994EC9